MNKYARLPLAAIAVALTIAVVAAPADAQRATDAAKGKATSTTAKTLKEKTPSVCKGLAQAQCTANQACTYVKASVRKTGQKVAAYCRLKTKGK